MVKRIDSLDNCREFIRSFEKDDRYSDPMLSTPEQIEVNLLNAVKKDNNHVLCVTRDQSIIGLFVFLIIEKERYAEMIVGLSRDLQAYEEIIAFLEREYPRFHVDFVFNPENDLLRGILIRKNAVFDEPQQKMVLVNPLPETDTTGIELLSDLYLEQYLSMHDTDRYWTGEKTAAAKERFRVFIAVDGQQAVGYLDVTCCFEENEPYDLFVKEEYRRKGWGRKLLARAIEMNRPNKMMLLVETDNKGAIRLYESLGFERVPGQDSQTATWIIKANSGERKDV